MKKNLQGKMALVTGASSGLGVDFARQLAQRGCQLILVARREDRLRKLQNQISSSFDVPVECIAMDLVEANAPQRLYDQIQAANWNVDVLVNNAGFGLFGNFANISWERTQSMLELDVIALTHLLRLFVADMVKRNYGFILNVASIGAYQPTPTYAVYSAAKS